MATYMVYSQNYDVALHTIDQLTTDMPEFSEFCAKQKAMLVEKYRQEIGGEVNCNVTLYQIIIFCVFILVNLL